MSTFLVGSDASAVTFVFGLADVEKWRSRGALVDVNIVGSRPFLVGAVQLSGPMGCVTQPEDYESGRWVTALAITQGEGLESEMSFSGSGFMWLVAEASLAYRVTLEGPDGTRWHDDGGGASGLNREFYSLSRGDWRIIVEELRGTDEPFVAFMWADMPESVSGGLQRESLSGPESPSPERAR